MERERRGYQKNFLAHGEIIKNILFVERGVK